MSPELGILELKKKTQYKTRTQNKCLSLFVRLSTGNQYTVFFIIDCFFILNFYYCSCMSVDWYSIESSSIYFFFNFWWCLVLLLHWWIGILLDETEVLNCWWISRSCCVGLGYYNVESLFNDYLIKCRIIEVQKLPKKKSKKL